MNGYATTSIICRSLVWSLNAYCVFCFWFLFSPFSFHFCNCDSVLWFYACCLLAAIDGWAAALSAIVWWTCYFLFVQSVFEFGRRNFITCAFCMNLSEHFYEQILFELIELNYWINEKRPFWMWIFWNFVCESSWW